MSGSMHSPPQSIEGGSHRAVFRLQLRWAGPPVDVREFLHDFNHDRFREERASLFSDNKQVEVRCSESSIRMPNVNKPSLWGRPLHGQGHRRLPHP